MSTVKELRQIAKERGINLRGATRKADIQRIIEESKEPMEVTSSPVSEQLEDMTLPQLRQFARENNIRLGGRGTKPFILTAIRSQLRARENVIVPSEEELNRMRVHELKGLARRLGLSTAGFNKPELIATILEGRVKPRPKQAVAPTAAPKKQVLDMNKLHRYYIPSLSIANLKKVARELDIPSISSKSRDELVNAVRDELRPMSSLLEQSGLHMDALRDILIRADYLDIYRLSKQFIEVYRLYHSEPFWKEYYQYHFSRYQPGKGSWRTNSARRALRYTNYGQQLIDLRPTDRQIIFFRGEELPVPEIGDCVLVRAFPIGDVHRIVYEKREEDKKIVLELREMERGCQAFKDKAWYYTVPYPAPQTAASRVLRIIQK